MVISGHNDCTRIKYKWPSVVQVPHSVKIPNNVYISRDCLKINDVLDKTT